MSALAIRPLVAADKPEWTALWRAYLAFYETELEPQIYDTSFARMIDPARTQQCGLIAERDGTPLGLVHYLFHAHNWRAEEVCYLQDLYVSPQARGQGLGRKLIETVYAQADTQGAPNVYWLTQEFNTEARQLYDRIGTLTPFVKYQR